MSLFSWLSSKPPQTDLEKFCAKLSQDKIAQIFDGEPNSLGLAKSYSLSLLYMAYEFLTESYKDKLVGNGKGLVRPNVVLFEVVTFLWAVIQAPIIRWAEDEMELEDDHEICNNISASLDLTLGLMQKYWPNVSLDSYSKSRIYIGKINDSATILADWILSGANVDIPAKLRKRSLDISIMPMTISCQLFASHMVPAALETLKRQVGIVLNRGVGISEL